MDDAGIVFVLAAGNQGLAELPFSRPIPVAERTPQRYGGTNSPIIMVGGVYRNGTLWERTSPDTPNMGRISVYALADRVETARANPASGFVDNDGTSFAAPVVAALAAYYMGFPQLETEFFANTGRGFAMNVKNYIVSKAYGRLAGGGGLPVAYNQAGLELGCDFDFTDPSVVPRAEVIKRQASKTFTLRPILVSGVLVATDIDLVCLPCPRNFWLRH